MKKIILICASLLALSFAFSQNQVFNEPNAQVRSVSSFHGINVATGIHLYLTQGNEEKVAVSANEKQYRDRIRTEVVDGVLKIYYEHENGWNSDNHGNMNLKAYVSCKSIDKLDASSGAHVDVDGSIQTGSLSLDFSSGAFFKGSVNVKNISVEASSGSHSVLSGTADECKASTSSGSHLEAYALQTNQCDANAHSGGHIEVTVNRSLVANASSGGHIEYKGEPASKSANTSSGGRVSKD